MSGTEPTMIYAGKDGCRVTAMGGVLTVQSTDGTVASIAFPSAETMGNMACKLTGHAAVLEITKEIAQEDAARAGAALACDLVNDVAHLHGHFHPTAVRTVRRALYRLAAQDHFSEANAGFTDALTSKLECDIAGHCAAARVVVKALDDFAAQNCHDSAVTDFADC